MRIINVRLENSAELCDIRICDGCFVAVEPRLAPLPEEDVLDAGGRMALPPFIESHVHLDTCLTAGQPVWNRSGTLFEGISCWAERKKTLSRQDVKERAARAVRMMALHGVQHVRTHVDVTDPTLAGMEAMLELREELRPLADIQIVAFPQEGICSYPNGKQLLREAMLMGADAVGAIPHFEFTREYAVESLNYCMELAQELDKLVDVHCDEIDDPQSRGLETLACRALESGMGARVTASHTTAMHSYDNAYCLRLFRLLKMSGINFVCNPLVNTHLQGRTDTYPRRRGVTRVKELLANGNNVSFGHDDIFDPWYPLGDGNLRDVVHMGLHACQLMGYDDIMQSYRLITHNAARTLHLGESYGIRVGNPANMILLDAENYYDALNTRCEVLYNIRHGNIIARATPAVRELLACPARC